MANKQEVNQVTAFMWYMYNKWGASEAVKVFGEDLGMHILAKFSACDENYLYAYSLLDRECRKKIIERAVEIYGDVAQWK